MQYWNNRILAWIAGTLGLTGLYLPAGLSAPLAPAPAVPETLPLFTRVSAAASGLSFTNRVDLQHPLRRVYNSSMAAGGIAVGDLDDNGLPDLVLTRGPDANRVFFQATPWKFKSRELPGDTWSSGVALADIENDGDLDMYICNYDQPNTLWINDGKGVFSEQAHAYGLDFADASLMAYFCDYDHDGDLDVFVICFQLLHPGGRPRSIASRPGPNGERILLPPHDRYYALYTDQETRRTGDMPFREIGRPNRLLRNEGPGKPFTDVTAQAGIGASPNFSNGAHWWDYDNDGWMDLYVANDYQDPDQLFRNQGDGTFVEVIREATPHTSFFSMGVAAGDLDNDGYFDLISADMAGSNHVREKTMMGDMSQHQDFLDRAEPRQFMRNAVFLATGTRHLREAGYMCNLARSDWSWAVKIGDYDCDGWQDVFISNGIVRNFNDADAPRMTTQMLIGRDLFDFYTHAPERRERNHAWKNQGDLEFDHRAQSWGLDYEGMSYAAAQADIDRDGDLDLVVTALDDPLLLYQNNAQDGKRLVVRLKGTQSNRYGYGAKLQLASSAGTQVRRINPCSGFCSFDEPLALFALPADAIAHTLTIDWPSGIRQVIDQPSLGQHMEIHEAGITKSAVQPAATRWFTSLDNPVIQHRETPFDDFKHQPLLPNKLSQLGPGQAWSPDGSLGFVGGAAGQAATLFKRGSAGTLTTHTFPHHAEREDIAAVFFDADGDGDEDLYVVSGSYEFPAGDERLRDRLYLQEAGTFTPSDSLPDLRDHGSCVSVGDWDRDDAPDLLVGSRVKNGAYPLSTPSRILVNEAGKFHALDVNLGMVTDVAWTDLNSDRHLDLVVTREYDSPLVIMNFEHGIALEHMEDHAALPRLHGWWNCATTGDFDADGDLDIALGNAGLNTKYHANVEHPAELYYGPFGKNDRMMIVETVYEHDQHFPVRGRSCSSAVKPDILFDFPTYAAFARAGVDAIYDPKKLATATRKKAHQLASGVLLNTPSGFRFTPFPRIAQTAPVNDIACVDVNGDGHLDLYLVQNFFTPQRETPRLGGGLSVLLLGDGAGGFTPVDSIESGLIVTGDARRVSVVDLNHDGRLDFSVTQNDGRLRLFTGQAARR